MARLKAVENKKPKSAWELWKVICSAIWERNHNLRADLLEKKYVEAFAEEIRRRTLNPPREKQRRVGQHWATGSVMNIDRRQNPARRADE